MNDENPFAKHGLTFLKNRLHVWAETVQQNPKLKDKEKESIELARIGLDTAFIDMLEYTKEEKTGRLSELIFQLMLYSVALGKCGPPTEISLLVEQSSIGAKINLKLNKKRSKKC